MADGLFRPRLDEPHGQVIEADEYAFVSIRNPCCWANGLNRLIKDRLRVAACC